MSDGVPHSRVMIPLALFMLSLMICSPLASSQSTSGPEGPGESWTLPSEHNLFLKGELTDPFLDRNWSKLTGEPLGRAEFTKSSSAFSPTLIDIQSAPLSESLRFQGNVTVKLYASLETTNDACRLSNVLPGSAGSETSFIVWLSMGSDPVLSQVSSNSLAMEESFGMAHEFTVQASDVNVSLSSGDMISLRVDVQHECIQGGVLWWGSYDAGSRIILEGDILDPSLEVKIDTNRMARVQFTPLSPWGESDFDWQVMEIVGPMDWDEMVHGNGDEEQRLDHFEIPHTTMVGEANRSVRAWSADKPLSPGKYMVDGCFVLTDQEPSSTCHSIGMLRFEVSEDPVPLLGSSWAVLIIPLSVILWIFFSIREATLPLMAYLVVLLLAISVLGPASQLPDINPESEGGRGAAPSFILLSHSSDQVSISLEDLMDGSDAVVVGLFQSGSPYAEHQRGDFESAKIILDQDVKFVQIATGGELSAVNLDGHALSINESWPLLMDEPDSSTGSAFPSGPTDAVIVIDPAGFISSWSPGTMSPNEISDAVESGLKGSGNGPYALFSMIISTALLPLIILGLPTTNRREDDPGKGMNPFIGVIMTTTAAGLGFAIWAIPISVMASIGLSSSWLLIEIALSMVLIYHGLSTLVKGSIIEVEKLSPILYSKLPSAYREWRGQSDFTRDAYLGLWLAWLSWLRMPYLVPQGIGSIARSGLLGPISSILVLSIFIISAGLVVSVVRAIASSFGKTSFLLGQMSKGIRPRAWGLASSVLGLWMLTSLVVLMLQVGV
ncbi:MAG: hypothetical protein CMA71_06350 [Euryarchaeota archaeon]|jgi:hypothetical protein|nr:hypothetical protein [Euryarchaeota archaeon]|tara:strand:+ start:142 stop:2484 length:2343 start_codon:yes stop_codon:yes gene_type:complete